MPSTDTTQVVHGLLCVKSTLPSAPPTASGTPARGTIVPGSASIFNTVMPPNDEKAVYHQPRDEKALTHSLLDGTLEGGLRYQEVGRHLRCKDSKTYNNAAAQNVQSLVSPTAADDHDARLNVIDTSNPHSLLAAADKTNNADEATADSDCAPQPSSRLERRVPTSFKPNWRVVAHLLSPVLISPCPRDHRTSTSCAATHTHDTKVVPIIFPGKDPTTLDPGRATTWLLSG